ncbi:PREDICTED: fatty acid synthase-like [Dinoponera quadriceps]|uniref:Fatty acid synthase-like n=1 Tax=Dinoponera quadriceps TaxID=609295 RepID=A0A6P3X535_DINQU|nr:PREDICTED: fatty acid synthase-like [Dinoponera quadriceps]
MESSKRYNPYVKVLPEEEIVISGISGRFPNSDNMKQLEENLLNKMDLGSDDSRRWSNAHANNPMCRMLLEHIYEAIIDAGAAGYPIVGCSRYLLANSISNWFGLDGPSYVLDTACSSSHYAMAEAYRMIRSGECDAAIVGGANICLHPNISLQFFQLGVLSNDGYCQPFDASGIGYMRSEAIAILYIQKAKDMRRIYVTYVYNKLTLMAFFDWTSS